jgi:RHS repeat-associated protein
MENTTNLLFRAKLNELQGTAITDEVSGLTGYLCVANATTSDYHWHHELTETYCASPSLGVLCTSNYSRQGRYRYGYQGQFAERDEETGWNHFELREYDAVVGRWLVPDPEHQYWSSYEAMRNAPIVCVDVQGSRVFFFTRGHAEKVMLNINALFKYRFKIEDAVSIVERVVPGTDKKGYYLQFNSKVDISKLSRRRQFVILSFKDALESNTDILGEIVDPGTKAGRATVGGYNGYTFSSTHFAVPSNLPDFEPNTLPRFTIGSQVLHELLWHISAMGRSFDFAGFTSSWLNNLFRARLGDDHDPGSRQNSAITPRDFSYYHDDTPIESGF